MYDDASQIKKNAGHGSVAMNGHLEEESHPGPPHDAFFFVLPYLPVFDLITIREVCRSLRSGVDGDKLVWMNIRVDTPLNSRLSDVILLTKIVSKAASKIASLSLIKCVKITDDGLQRVIDQNPLMNKLYLPGCSGLTPEGVTRAVKTLTKQNHKLKALKISGIHGINKHHLQFLQSCLLQNPSSLPPNHYHRTDLHRAIDVEVCPKCDNVRMVFECPRQSCRRSEGKRCIGCCFCIPRCEGCGGCVDESDDGFCCCDNVACSDCWLRLLPKCNFCNKPYCKNHAPVPNSTSFICINCHFKSTIPDDFE